MQNIDGLDWKALLSHLAQEAQSDLAKNHLLQIQPLDSLDQARQEAQYVEQAQEFLALFAPPSLYSLDQMPRLLELLRIQSTLGIADFSNLRKFLNAAAELRRSLNEIKNPWTIKTLNKLGDYKPLLDILNKILTPEGEMSEDASPKLSALNDEKKKLSRELTEVLDRLVSRHHSDAVLQDHYVTTREGRLVLPVKSSFQNEFKGKIHGRSYSKQTVFMEPEVSIPINNRLSDLQTLIQEEIERILVETSRSFSKQSLLLLNTHNALLDADRNFAKARLNKKLKGQVCEFKGQESLTLKDARHPLLVLQGQDVVPNTLALSQAHRILLLSGPNAGGKTILLKTIGLCAHMARCGLPIPAARDSTMPFFKSIHALVGDQQSVANHLSSFSSHVENLTGLTKESGSQALILVDEICGSTDPEEGAALARSFMEHFANAGVYGLVTSHLNDLKRGWSTDSPVFHGSMEFNSKSGIPTYKYVPGIPGQSLALSIAKRHGVPDSILKGAYEHLSPSSKEAASHLVEIEVMRAKIQEMTLAIEAEKALLEKEKVMYKDLVSEFRNKKDAWLEKFQKKTEKKVDQLLEEGRRATQNQKNLQDIKAELPTVIKAAPSVRRPTTIDEFQRLFTTGSMVFCSRLNRTVILQSQPDSKGQVFVLADSMRVLVPWHTISSVLEMGSEKEAHQTSQRRPEMPAGDVSLIADLRGFTTSDAVDYLEGWLDQCIRAEADRVKVIHGFGTEQLKKSVRQYLSKSPYVKSWAPGDSTTGGDGVTWAELK